jgi:hypothetical protein
LIEGTGTGLQPSAIIMRGRGVGMNRIFVAWCWGLGVLCVANLVMNGSSSMSYRTSGTTMNYHPVALKD